MGMFARIENGAVAELLATEATVEGLFHPSLRWVAVGEAEVAVAVGWRHGAAGFAPPPPEPAAAAPSLAELHARIGELAAQVAARLAA
jgi:hypothetical protein